MLLLDLNTVFAKTHVVMVSFDFFSVKDSIGKYSTSRFTSGWLKKHKSGQAAIQKRHK